MSKALTSFRVSAGALAGFNDANGSSAYECQTQQVMGNSDQNWKNVAREEKEAARRGGGRAREQVWKRGKRGCMSVLGHASIRLDCLVVGLLCLPLHPGLWLATSRPQLGVAAGCWVGCCMAGFSVTSLPQSLSVLVWLVVCTCDDQVRRANQLLMY